MKHCRFLIPPKETEGENWCLFPLIITSLCYVYYCRFFKRVTLEKMNVRLRSKDSKPPPSNTRIGLKCPLHDFGRPTFNIKTHRNQANQDSRPKAKSFFCSTFCLCSKCPNQLWRKIRPTIECEIEVKPKSLLYAGPGQASQILHQYSETKLWFWTIFKDFSFSSLKATQRNVCLQECFLCV